MAKIKAPKGLSEAGKGLWDDLTADYEFRPDELLLVERAAPDVLFERVEVLVFRAEEEVPRDAMGPTLTHAAPVAAFPTPPRWRFAAWACREWLSDEQWVTTPGDRAKLG